MCDCTVSCKDTTVPGPSRAQRGRYSPAAWQVLLRSPCYCQVTVGSCQPIMVASVNQRDVTGPGVSAASVRVCSL